MLLKLSISNFILIDACSIEFHAGLNVITGETGSGKSIILAALGFLLGDKADASSIRQGATSASCQAVFEVKKESIIFSILEEAGIEYSAGDELIIKREQTAQKSRIFINNQIAAVSLVKKIAPYLIEFSGQHAHLKLLNEGEPLELLDAYCDLAQIKKAYLTCWQQKKELEKEIAQLVQKKERRDDELLRLEAEISEIEQAKLKDDEEETLFAEFQLLANSEELAQKISELTQGISDSKSALVPALARLKLPFEKLSQLDPTLATHFTTFCGLTLEFQEIGYELKRYQAHLEFQPERFQIVDERLKEINRLKKKYGQSLDEIMRYCSMQKEKVKNLLALDVELDEKKNLALQIDKEVEAKAQLISKKRKEGAKKLEKEITQEIQGLNMPHALFSVEVTPKQRCATGDDEVSFLLTPNLGEARIPIKEASGGELARVALAIKRVYSDDVPTIVFDEIDANIGGKTAQLIGEKLALLGKSMQVISITHFAQVALWATSHFRIYKFEKEGRTLSQIEQLENKSSKDTEIKRMLGGVLQ